MQIIINNYEGKEKEQIKQLLKLYSEDEFLLNIINSSQLKFAYSAFIDNKLVGFVITWKSSFHSYCTYFRILSNPFYKLNIEEVLLSKVEELKIEDFPLQTSAWETSNNLTSLYIKNGFKEIRRTYSPMLKVSDLAEYNLNIRNNNHIRTLEKVVSNEVLMGKLTHLVKRIYEKTHLVNPVANFEVDKWQEMILADDVIQNGSYVYLDKDEKNIIAYSFLHESDKINSLELGWCGAIDTEHKWLIPQLVLNQVEYANKHDFQFLMGEFDTTDEYAMEVLNNFPFSPSPTWITFQKG